VSVISNEPAAHLNDNFLRRSEKPPEVKTNWIQSGSTSGGFSLRRNRLRFLWRCWLVRNDDR